MEWLNANSASANQENFALNPPHLMWCLKKNIQEFFHEFVVSFSSSQTRLQTSKPHWEKLVVEKVFRFELA